MELKNYYAQDSQGNILPGADCTLYLAGTSDLASGLQDANGNPMANPFKARSDGLVQFAAPNGRYDLQIAKDGRLQRIRIQCNDVAGNVLVADLSDPDKGAAMVARGVVAVDSIADLLALPESARREDLRYLVRGFHTPDNYLSSPYSGGGEFSWSPSINRNLHNGGTIISPSVPWDGTEEMLAEFLDGLNGEPGFGAFVRVFEGAVNSTWFGLKDRHGTHQTAILQKALNSAKPSGSILGSVVVPPNYSISLETITIPPNVELVVSGSTLEFHSGDGILFSSRTVLRAENTQIHKRVSTPGSLFKAASTGAVTSAVQILGFPELLNSTANRDSNFVALDMSGFYNCKIEIAPSHFGRGVQVSGDLPVYYNSIHLRANRNDVTLYSNASLFNGNQIHLLRANAVTSNVVIDGAPDVGEMASGSNTFHVTYAEGTTGYGFDLNGAGGTVILGGAIEGVPGATGVGIRLRGCSRTTILGVTFGNAYSNRANRLVADEACTGTTYIGGSNARDDVISWDGAITRTDELFYERLFKTATDEVTPDVSSLRDNGAILLTSTEPGLQVTNLLNGRQGQIIHVMGGGVPVTLKHATTGGFRMVGATDVTLTLYSVVTFIYVTSALGVGAGWVELSRSIK